MSVSLIPQYTEKAKFNRDALPIELYALRKLMSFYDFFSEKLRAWIGVKKRPANEGLLPASLGALDIADDMEPTFPLELELEAVPLSLKASPESRNAWKQQIRGAIDEILDPAGWATTSPVS